MKDKQILKKAIEKVVRNLPNQHLNEWSIHAYIDDDNEFRCSEVEIEDIYNIIFFHDFAKAFWGEKITEVLPMPKWQYHLQQMVLKKEPLKYLEKFL